MLLEYIILSCILSIAGFFTYQTFFKKNLGAFHRKVFLHSLVGLSLVLPLFIISFQPDFQFENEAHSNIPYAHNTHVEWVLEEELTKCYNLAINEKEFCDCQDLEENNLILYKEDQFYNGMISLANVVKPIFLIVAGCLFLLLLIRIFYLLRIIRSSRQEVIQIEGKEYTLLHYDGSLMAASFRLFKRYVIWKPALGQLTDKERNAVLMHEVAHLQNKDTWELIILNLIQTIWVFNPIYYKIKKELELLNEFLADEFAVLKVGDRLGYASLLIKLKEQQKHALVAQFGDSSLSLRIQELLEPTTSKFNNIYPLIVGISSFLLATGYMSATPIHQQEQAFEQYQYIQNQYLETGKTYFCKTCLYDEINACQ